jgi:signal transduction histidine kinase
MSVPSLQRRLAWRLGLVLTAAMLVLSSVVTHFAWTALDDVDDASLETQVEQLIAQVTIDDSGATLELPPALQQAYLNSGDAYLYALLDAEGRVLDASSNAARRLASMLPRDLFDRGEAVFRLPDPNRPETPYLAFIRGIPGAHAHRLVVAQRQFNTDVLIDTLVAEFFEHLGWTLPIIILLALAISLWTIRSSLKPVEALSLRAAQIKPQTADMRLPETGVPREIRPLVTAINSALDRLQKGFEVQRQFTANAAHELRTPLAVLTGRLEELGGDGAAVALAEDVARMNRLVAQLLRVSRLDTSGIAEYAPVDLNSVAATVVGFLAPLAIERQRTIALLPSDPPALVTGSGHAIEDALRNLVENALTHAPLHSEITVTAHSDGSITVRDHGPGVPAEWREKIFERFWRGSGQRGNGAGLGLAIVREIAAAHGGSVSVDDAPDGGAIFTLRLPLRRAPVS